MRRLFVACGIAITLLILFVASTEAAEDKWQVADVEGSDGQSLGHFAINGDPAVGEGNFQIGCHRVSRHILLKTGKLNKAVVSIAAKGFADIELYNGKSTIEIPGQLFYTEKSNSVHFSATGIDKNKFNLIANALLNGTGKLGFRIREGGREKPGFTFATTVGIDQKAAAAVEDVLRNCGFI